MDVYICIYIEIWMPWEMCSWLLQLFNLGKEKTEPVTGLQFDRMPCSDLAFYRYYILATTPGWVRVGVVGVGWFICACIYGNVHFYSFSPVGSWSSNGMRMCLCVCVCVCVCVDGMNLTYALRWHIHASVHSAPCHTSYTRTRASSNHLRTANQQG